MTSNQMIKIKLKALSTVPKEPPFSKSTYLATFFLAALPMSAVLIHIFDRTVDDSIFFFLGTTLTVVSAITPIIIMRGDKSGNFRFFQKDSGITLCASRIPFLCGITLAFLANVTVWSTLGSPHTHIGYVLTIGIVAAIVLTVWIAAFSIPPRVILTEFGVQVSSAMGGSRFVSWDKCPAPVTSINGAMNLPMKNETAFIPTTANRTDPRILSAVINFYRSHPELRSELTDNRFATRLRNGDLPIDWTWPPPNTSDPITSSQEPDQQ